MSEMVRGREEGAGGCLGGGAAVQKKKGWMCQRPQPVKNRLTFDQSKSD